VSPSQLPNVQRYIANQVEHHRTKTFEEEYVELLRLIGVDFDREVFVVINPCTPSGVRSSVWNILYPGVALVATRLTPG
jgi:hypothetical protein